MGKRLNYAWRKEKAWRFAAGKKKAVYWSLWRVENEKSKICEEYSDKWSAGGSKKQKSGHRNGSRGMV